MTNPLRSLTAYVQGHVHHEPDAVGIFPAQYVELIEPAELESSDDADGAPQLGASADAAAGQEQRTGSARSIRTGSKKRLSSRSLSNSLRATERISAVRVPCAERRMVLAAPTAGSHPGPDHHHAAQRYLKAFDNNDGRSATEVLELRSMYTIELSVSSAQSSSAGADSSASDATPTRIITVDRRYSDLKQFDSQLRALLPELFACGKITVDLNDRSLNPSSVPASLASAASASSSAAGGQSSGGATCHPKRSSAVMESRRMALDCYLDEVLCQCGPSAHALLLAFVRGKEEARLDVAAIVDDVEASAVPAGANERGSTTSAQRPQVGQRPLERLATASTSYSSDGNVAVAFLPNILSAAGTTAEQPHHRATELDSIGNDSGRGRSAAVTEGDDSRFKFTPSSSPVPPSSSAFDDVQLDDYDAAVDDDVDAEGNLLFPPCLISEPVLVQSTAQAPTLASLLATVSAATANRIPPQANIYAKDSIHHAAIGSKLAFAFSDDDDGLRQFDELLEDGFTTVVRAPSQPPEQRNATLPQNSGRSNRSLRIDASWICCAWDGSTDTTSIVEMCSSGQLLIRPTSEKMEAQSHSGGAVSGPLPAGLLHILASSSVSSLLSASTQPAVPGDAATVTVVLAPHLAYGEKGRPGARTNPAASSNSVSTAASAAAAAKAQPEVLLQAPVPPGAHLVYHVRINGVSACKPHLKQPKSSAVGGVHGHGRGITTGAGTARSTGGRPPPPPQSSQARSGSRNAAPGSGAPSPSPSPPPPASAGSSASTSAAAAAAAASRRVGLVINPSQQQHGGVTAVDDELLRAGAAAMGIAVRNGGGALTTPIKGASAVVPPSASASAAPVSSTPTAAVSTSGSAATVHTGTPTANAKGGHHSMPTPEDAEKAFRAYLSAIGAELPKEYQPGGQWYKKPNSATGSSAGSTAGPGTKTPAKTLAGAAGGSNANTTPTAASTASPKVPLPAPAPVVVPRGLQQQGGTAIKRTSHVAAVLSAAGASAAGPSGSGFAVVPGPGGSAASAPAAASGAAGGAINAQARNGPPKPPS